jgi:chemotaxis protein CheC
MLLNASQLDRLRDAINVGVTYAAGSLNEMVGTPITLQVPEVEVLPLDEARMRITVFGSGRVASVQLAFAGPIKGNVALVFPYDSAVNLVSLLTGDDGCNADVDGIRAATLEETSNIILNGVVGSISNLLEGRISFSIPYYSEQEGLPARFTGPEFSASVQVVLARARFVVAQHEIMGEIFLFFEMVALQSLIAALNRLNAPSPALC